MTVDTIKLEGRLYLAVLVIAVLVFLLLRM